MKYSRLPEQWGEEDEESSYDGGGGEEEPRIPSQEQNEDKEPTLRRIRFATSGSTTTIPDYFKRKRMGDPEDKVEWFLEEQEWFTEESDSCLGLPGVGRVHELDGDWHEEDVEGLTRIVDGLLADYQEEPEEDQEQPSGTKKSKDDQNASKDDLVDPPESSGSMEIGMNSSLYQEARGATPGDRDESPLVPEIQVVDDKEHVDVPDVRVEPSSIPEDGTQSGGWATAHDNTHPGLIPTCPDVPFVESVLPEPTRDPVPRRQRGCIPDTQTPVQGHKDVEERGGTGGKCVL